MADGTTHERIHAPNGTMQYAAKANAATVCVCMHASALAKRLLARVPGDGAHQPDEPFLHALSPCVVLLVVMSLF